MYITKWIYITRIGTYWTVKIAGIVFQTNFFKPVSGCKIWRSDEFLLAIDLPFWFLRIWKNDFGTYWKP